MVYVSSEKSMNKVVSVVIPVYNSIPFLQKCLDSILKQTYNALDIILVNDGSTDESGELCDKYALMDERITVIHKNNGGLVSSRKAGIEKAKGEYVLYVDGDDWIEPELVETYMQQVYRYGADVVIASHNVNLEGRIEVLKNTIPPGVYSGESLSTEVYPKMLFTGKFSQFGIFSYSWGKLFKKAILIPNQQAVSNEIVIGEDALCTYPTLLDANTIVILEKPYYHYVQRANSLIKTLRNVEISKMSEVYQALKKALEKKQVRKKILTQLDYYLLSILITNTEGPALDTVNAVYPFINIHPTDRLVIYGGGTFGQHFYKKLNKYNIKNIVGWIDERFVFYQKLNLPVNSLDTIKSLEYDKIVIALMDECNSNYATELLCEVGVDRSKIIQIPRFEHAEVRALLSQYKFII